MLVVAFGTMLTILVSFLLVIVITKIVFSFTAMRPYSGHECLVGKVALVVGGSTGIGLEVCRCLASRDCKVIVACRSSSDKLRSYLVQQTDNLNITVKYVDLMSFTSVRRFAEEMLRTEAKIDIFINNAGLSIEYSSLTEDKVDALLQANVISSFLLTHLLIDLLKKSDDPRIIFTSSILAFTHNLSLETLVTDRNGENFTLADHILRYGNSKLLQILVSNIFAEKLQKFGIKSNAMHPGMVDTDFVKKKNTRNKSELAFQICFGLIMNLYGRTIPEGAAGIVELAVSSKHRNTTGKFFWGFGMSNVSPSPRPLRDRELCAEVWKQLEILVQLKPEETLK